VDILNNRCLKEKQSKRKCKWLIKEKFMSPSAAFGTFLKLFLNQFDGLDSQYNGQKGKQP
jgi:hypothetical protein